MLGLVLCGGQSTRMGSDKGLLTFSENISWAEQCFSLLDNLNIPVVVSVNENQLADYKNIFPSDRLITDNSEIEMHGPLLGLLSAHINYPGQDIFVLACDMIEMNSIVLKHLHKYYLKSNPGRTCVFANDNNIEPLCAIYPAKDISLLLKFYQDGLLEKHSMKYCFEKLDVEKMSIPFEWKDYFKNYNTILPQR